jgi:hypothetical protein
MTLQTALLAPSLAWRAAAIGGIRAGLTESAATSSLSPMRRSPLRGGRSLICPTSAPADKPKGACPSSTARPSRSLRHQRQRQHQHPHQYPARSPSPMTSSPPVLRAAEPLAVGDRDAFLRDVAAALQGQELGGGAVYRVIAQPLPQALRACSLSTKVQSSRANSELYASGAGPSSSSDRGLVDRRSPPLAQAINALMLAR